MNQFEELTSRNAKTTIAGDLVYFMRHSKKWWMGPIILLVLLFGTLMLLGGTAAAPFIYTLF